MNRRGNRDRPEPEPGPRRNDPPRPPKRVPQSTDDGPADPEAYLEYTIYSVSGRVPIDAVPFTIGRDQSSSLHLPLADVSRCHAEMHRCSGQFVIVDLASVLGVFVNGIKVVKCILRNDDQIAIGDATLLYQQPCRYSTMF